MHRRLVLFDIDGTLLLDHGGSRDAFAVALRETYDCDPPLVNYDFSGKTDPQITLMVMRDAGLSEEEITAGFERLWPTYVRELGRRIARESVTLMPSVRELLEMLVRDDLVMLGLLTGNIEPGARIKLSSWDLNGYFGFGAFGSDHKDREMLPPIAVERASRIDGHRFEGENIVIIGDSIHDVRCGVPHGATTIAVPTGRTAEAKLRAENPTHLFPTLQPTEELLRAIRGG